MDYLSSAVGMSALSKFRKSSGLTQAELADLVHSTQAAIQKLEAGTRKLTREWAERLAPHLDITPQELMFPISLKQAPVVGFVGAGTEVFGERDGDPEMVEVPFVNDVVVEVVVVQGDSMYPVYRDGDRLIFEAVSRPVDDLIGRECVVELEDGRKFVKVIRRVGSEIVLESFNAPSIADVRIVAAWPVRWIERR